MFYEILKLLAIIGSGMATAIPLIIKLAECVEKANKEKNWNQVLNLVMNLMAEAEKKFDEGADKKEWVIAMVKVSADTINYDINFEQIGNLIDSLCAMSKNVNYSAEK